MNRVLKSIAIIFIVCVYPISSHAQSCRLSSTTGAGATVNLVASYPLTGSTPAATASVDGVYYQLSNQLGIGPTPVVRTMYTNWMQTAANDSHPAYYGALFANPTNSAVTVTSVTVSADVNHFTTPNAVGINPTTGWQLIDRRNARWTGSISVPAHAARQFIFADAPQNNQQNPGTRNLQLNASIVTNAGTFAAAPYAVTANTGTPLASNAVVAFDTTGGWTFTPAMSVTGATSTAPVNLSVRVRETGNNGTNSGIETGLQLTVTIPPRWSAVSVPTIAAPWRAGTLTITQPTATTAGQIVITTNRRIAAGRSTPANSLVIRATAPTSSATNLFPFHLQLAGLSRGRRTISSFCDPVVQVLGNGTEAVNVEFLSASIGPGPVRQIDLATDFNVVNGSGADTVRVDVFNNGTAGWDAIQTVTPGSTNVSVPRTFTTDFEPYVDATNRMRIRFVSTGTDSRTLRIDRVQWTMTLGYTVDNSRGSDTNPGNNTRPFATIAKAASLLGASGAVYVEVGNSQTGTPYVGNVNVTAAGIASCPTLVQGVPNLGGSPPVVRGVNPSADWGFDVLASQVNVTGFRIENMAVALAAENPSNGIVFDSNSIQASTNGYGIVLNNYSTPTLPATASSGLQATNNTIDGTGFQPFMGIFDAGAQGSLIDSNKILAVPNFGMYFDSAASPVIQRNVVTGNYLGIYLARTTGAKLYNNSVDLNSYRGIDGETSTGIVSRNNIISRNPIGFSTDTASSVDSDYDDVWSNATPYIGITAGANSIAADPLFVQTTTPSLATYYRLNSGSPCIDKGVYVGLPFLGLKPDLGAVETQ